MQATTSIIQNLVVSNGVQTTVTPPPNCFRCTISFIDDSGGMGKGFVSTSDSELGYSFANFYESNNGSPNVTTNTGNVNTSIVLDRRGIGYMIDNFICQIKSTVGPCTFTFIWEVVV